MKCWPIAMLYALPEILPALRINIASAPLFTARSWWTIDLNGWIGFPPNAEHREVLIVAPK
jgi:hypothetical protein